MSLSFLRFSVVAELVVVVVVGFVVSILLVVVVANLVSSIVPHCCSNKSKKQTIIVPLTLTFFKKDVLSCRLASQSQPPSSNSVLTPFVIIFKIP